ncbi:2-oxo-hept-4-ene-1,7-dioate hydratase [Nitratireductor sp. XY-223]|uniref:2-oxo-hept-4-ene-1,7-dioate hydratase n=1 Tax=Nitratireductor sp. XY-223 TaxID=2561926 RepID=UPI00197D437D|nr:2-oxo-hepta-3-ene-1,7-dioic acid hydratase [Nitratireductor sp. XY-223]
MSLSKDEIAAAAADLFQAEKSGAQIGLLSRRHPDMTMDDAYAVQAALVERKRQAGRSIVGWKIGLTSKAMQDVLKIDIPDSGILFDDMLFEDGGTVPPGRFIRPRIEAEIAFAMKAPLSGTSITRDAVLAATDYVAPSLEILDTRILRSDPETGQPRSIVDTIADNAANAGVVLGTQRHDPAAFDLRWTGAILMRNGEVEETGLGAGVLNDPVAGIVWLVERLAAYDQSIRAGDVVLSGSFIRPVEARPGDHFHADFGPFGTVTQTFA